MAASMSEGVKLAGGKLVIHQPKLEVLNVARVGCKITEVSGTGDILEKTVTFDVDRAWQNYLVTENVNAYLVGCLPYAMRNGMDIVLEAPVSSSLLHNLEKVLVPHLVKSDERLHATQIHAIEVDTAELENAAGVGTGMSMGVDSFHTVHEYMDPKYHDLRLTHLLVEQVGDLVQGVMSSKHGRNVNESTVAEVATELGLPVIFSHSNFRQIFRMKHYNTHTYTAMFNVHMLAKLFRSYFYASTEDFSHFSLAGNSTRDAALHELLSLQALSTSSLTLRSGGVASDRIEKTRVLADSKVARKFLRVCLRDEENCMNCMKCHRTLLTLDMQGNLDQFSNVFDIDAYHRDRDFHLSWLIRSYHRDSAGISTRDLYEFFVGSDPDRMARLEAQYLGSYEALDPPRYMRVVQTVHKVDPVTGKKSRRPVMEGDQIYFVDKLAVNDIVYLRTEADARKGLDRGVPDSALRQLSFAPMKRPRTMRVNDRLRMIDPLTKKEVGREIEAGRDLRFDEMMRVDGVLYLRTRSDARRGRERGIPITSLSEIE